MKNPIIWVIVAVLILGGLYANSKRSSFINQEAGITASFDSNKAVLDKITQAIQGSGLAVDKYGDMVIKAITAAMTGRYGSSGSKAAMQWIQENAQGLDPAIFNKLQQTIEANFAEWSAAQISLRDRTRVYEVNLKVFPNNIFAGIFGFPSSGFDMSLYKRMIVTDSTSEAFKSGKMKSINDLLKK